MHPAPFEYARVASAEEAVDRLAAADGEAAILAGGQGLVNRLKARERTPDLIVDIGRIEGLDRIATTDAHLEIGALVTHRRLAEAEAIRSTAPALADAAAALGDRQVRNRGTLVGNLVEAAPGADPPAVALAHDAQLLTRAPDGGRTVPVDRLYAGDDAIGPAEVVRHVRLAVDDAGAYVRRTHPASGWALVGVAVTLRTEHEAARSARVGLVGAVERPQRLPAVEAAIAGVPLEDAPAVAAAAARDVELATSAGDHHAGARYRRELLPSQVRQACRRTVEGAVGR